jgi:23S rRNA (pseudouridine1915-N3)-methyltransferase
MSRAIFVLWAGRHHRPEWEALCADYRKRIERDSPVVDIMVKVKAAAEDPSRRKLETRALFAAAPEPSWTIALDPRGRQLSTEDFAAELARLRTAWPHPVAFLIGSDLGLDDELLGSARDRFSFGRMIFGHELARLVLYEQIYRAFSVHKGLKYHRPAP